MSIITKFDVGQRLFIVENDYHPCRVTKITQSGQNLYYGVEYWLNGEIKFVELSEDELSAERRVSNGSGFVAQ